MQDCAKPIDFSNGIPLMAVLKKTHERVQIIEYIPEHPPKFRVRREGKKKTQKVWPHELEIEEIGTLAVAQKNLRPLSAVLKTKIRRRLHKEKLKVQRELWVIKKGKRDLLKDSPEQISGNHPAEINVDYASPTLKQRGDNCEKRIWKIDLSLLRLEENLYGLCKVCGRQIPLPRLEANLIADTCADCKEDSRLKKKKEG